MDCGTSEFKTTSSQQSPTKRPPQSSRYAPLTTHGLPHAPSQRSAGTTSPHRFAAAPISATSPASSIASSLHVTPATLRSPAKSQTPVTPGDGNSFRPHRLALAPSVGTSPITPLSSVFSYRHLASLTSSRATSIAPSSPDGGNTGPFEPIAPCTSSPTSPTLRSPRWPPPSHTSSINAATRLSQPSAFQPQLSPVRFMRAETSPPVLPPFPPHRTTKPSPSKTRSRPPPLDLQKHSTSRVAKHVAAKDPSPRRLSPHLLALAAEDDERAVVYSDLPLRRVEVTLPERYSGANPKSPILTRLSQRFKTGLKSHFHKKPDGQCEKENVGLKERRKGKQYSKADRTEVVEALHWTEI